ncbi:MAG: DNA topoisomerase 4 subunit A [Clostridia bacterium]|nr:DNA topoisomerase 4 subunit A [Clostridia bacterium]
MLSKTDEGIKKEDRLADGSKLIEKSIELLMNESMLPYAEAVIMDRALPRVEDGLKPVQRRILYSMQELGLTADSHYLKSARIVGDCMGKYHPHGESSVYLAMVRMAQDFNMSAPLVDGQGNFGSIDGDSAAAMRYTEARMTPLALEMLRDLKKGTVTWSRNYDDSTKEPNVLPGRFPNLLVNGASGIAVGLATSIPPHNLNEAIEGVIAYIDNPKISLEEMMTHIKGPDFPSGCLVLRSGLEEAYRTGKGSVMMRSVMHVETDKNDKKSIVITRMPYQVIKADLLVKIIKLRENNKEKLGAITDVVDESDKEGMRTVIKLKKDADVEQIVEILLNSTELQKRFFFNMVAIADGRPKQLGLLEIIGHYSDYQHQVVLNRCKFELEEAKEREHILQGLVIAVTNIDEVIAIIKASQNTTAARNALRARFDLSERQAQAILDLRLARLTKLEVEVLENELREIEARVRRLTAIITSKRLLSDLVKTELTEILRTYKTVRKSELVEDFRTVAEITSAGAKAEDCVVAISADGCIKRMPKSKFIAGFRTPGDALSASIELKTDEEVYIVTDSGGCVKTSTENIPQCNYTDGGAKLKAICKDAQKEAPIALFTDKNLNGADMLIYTDDGSIKRSNTSILKVNKDYYKIMVLKDNAKVVGAEIYDKDKYVMFVSDKGLAVNFTADDMYIQGRIAGGSRAINLDEKDKTVFASQVSPEGDVAVVTREGFGKRVRTKELGVMTKGRKGIKLVELGDGDSVSFVCDATSLKQIALYGESESMVISTEALSVESRSHKGRQIKKGLRIINAVELA